jgi:pimeloyl-ACP methyl ester carboxylesterase
MAWTFFRSRAGAIAAALVLVTGAAVIVTARQAVAAPDRFTVTSDRHPMAVWARIPPNPRGAVLLVHGRTWSSRPDFDLQVPGLRRSVLMSLAAQGLAAYAVDMRGYGETPRDDTGWLTPNRAAADILNVLAWVTQRHPTLPKPALVGWSRGAAHAMLAAMQSPTKMSALVLFGFAFAPDAEFQDSVAPDKPLMLKNTAADAASDFVSPNVTPPAVVQAFVAQALRSDPVTADLKNDKEFNALKPENLIVPTLVLFGERDINVPPSDASAFFAAIDTPDKAMAMLPGADHAAQLEDTHDAWIAAVVNFVTRPAVRQ